MWSELQDDLSLLYTISALRELISKVANETGVSMKDVLPVKNYSHEHELNDAVSVGSKASRSIYSNDYTSMCILVTQRLLLFLVTT